MAEERLVFSIFAQLREDGFTKASRAARATSGDVAALSRRLTELGSKSETARVGLAGNKEMLAQLDALQVRMIRAGGRITPEMSLEGAAKVAAELSALEAGFDKLDAKAAGSTASVGLSGLSGPSGMGALIGAGVALSPVIATVGTGLAGFGAAAYGVIAPIEKAAGETGGLRANMAKLDPEQKVVARSILALGKQYDAFSASLQPEVLTAFSTAIRIAGNVMHDVQPVAKVTGKAFDELLAQFGATLQDPAWRQFWAFMAKTAPADMRLLGNVVIDLTNDLPPLLENLQPVATGLLKDADAALKLADAGGKLVAWEHAHAQAAAEGTGWLGRLGGAVKQAYLQMVPGARAAGDLQKALGKVAGSSGTADPPMHMLAQTFTLAQLRAQGEKIAVDSLTGSLNKMISPILTLEGDQVSWRQSQIAATAAIKASSGSLDSNRASALAARQAVIQSTQAAITFAGQEVTVHHNVRAASDILQAQITYLEKHAGKSKIAAAEIDALRKALNKLPASVRANVDIIGHGSGGISYHDQIAGQRKKGFLEFHAAGGPVRGVGTGTSDSNLIAASRGEWVMRAAAVEKYGTAMMAAINAGRFAAGGLVGNRSVLDKGIPYVASTGATFEHQAMLAGTRALMAAALAAARAAAAMPSGGGGGGLPANWHSIASFLAAHGFTRYAAAGVAGNINAESGGNPEALQGGGGGGGGLIQWTPISAYPGYVTGSYARDFSRQMNAILRWGGGPGAVNRAISPADAAQIYQDVYERPASLTASLGARMASANAVYAAMGWGNPNTGALTRRTLDSGGYLPPGLSLAWNGTGQPERVGGGGTVININVTVSPLARPADVGREVVAAIKEFEKRSGPGWRK